MWHRDRGLTELVFLAGLLLLPLDGFLWGAGLPALFIASALAYGIAWELPRLLFREKVGAIDQLSSSVALTFVLLCFYLGKSDKAVADIIQRQGQTAAFPSPLWVVSDGVLLALTIAVMMVLLAATTLLLQAGEERGWLFTLPRNLGRGLVGVLVGSVIGLGGGAWAVAVSTKGFGLGVASWIAMWIAVRVGGALSPRGKGRFQGSVLSGLVAMGLGAIIGGTLGAGRGAFLAAFVGGMAAFLHFLIVPSLPEPLEPRPKDAPFYVPWVGFYTARFIGLVVAFFTLGATWLWGLR